MPRSISSLKDEFDDRVEEGKERIALNAKMDAMARNEWELPTKLPWWVKKVVSSDPSDALATGARTLSTVEPKPNVIPPDNHPETQERMNELEMALRWQYNLANKRSPTNITRDIVMSALRYDDIAVQVIDLKFQEALNQPKKKKGSKKPWNIGGDFIIIPHHPSTVYPVRTYMGLESVLLVKNMSYKSVLSQWGKENTAELRARYKEEEFEWVTYYDLTDGSDRCVLVFPTTDALTISQPEGKQPITICNEPHGLPFLNWVSMYGGSSLDEEEEFQRHPLLATIAQTDQWQIQCLLESIVNSLVIELAASPKTKSQTFSGQTPTMSYDEVGSNVELQVGENFDALPPPPLDPNLKEMIDRISARINKSTVARFLQNLDLPPGAAYATINAVMQSAINALDPYKKLAENAIAGIYTQMLMWSYYQKRPLTAYYSVERKNANYGRQISYDYKLIDPENLNITCELTATVPTDMLQRINAGVLMYRDLRYPLQRVYEDLGVNDPEAAERTWVSEKMFETFFSNYLSQIVFEEQRRQQSALQEDALKMKEAAASQQNQQQQLATATQQTQQYVPSPAYSAMNQQQAINRATVQSPEDERLAQMNEMFAVTQGGQGFNPNEGGVSPAQVFPQGTREVLTGKTKGGRQAK